MTTKSKGKRGLDKQRMTFARHQSFQFRDRWLHKGLKALSKDPLALNGKESHHDLGLGKNMLMSLRYWIQATGLAEGDASSKQRTKPLLLTDLGQIILNYDPYFEDAITLWFVHIELSSNREMATFWYLLFNEYGNRDFNSDRVVLFVQDFLQEIGRPDSISHKSFANDFSCLLRTYIPSDERSSVAVADTDCPLSTLGLLRTSGTPGMYRFSVGAHRDMPTEAFAYCLYRFKERPEMQDTTIGIEDLRWSAGGPGRLLCMDSRGIAERLEELENWVPAAADVIRTAGLNAVYLDPKLTAVDIARNYYQSYERDYD